MVTFAQAGTCGAGAVASLARRLVGRRGSRLRTGAAIVALVPCGWAQEVWRLDDLRTVGGHPVTIVGAPQVASVGGAAAVTFDGARDGVFVESIPIAGATEFTIEVLFSPDEGGGTEQRFLHVRDRDGRRALLELRANGTGGWWLDAFLRTRLDPADRGLVLIDPKRVHPTGQWHWVAMRYDGTRLTSFVNGAKELEGETVLFPFGEGQVSLGVRQNRVSWFRGAIREVRFHRAVLADEKLQRVAEGDAAGK